MRRVAKHVALAVLSITPIVAVGAGNASAQCGETIDLAPRHSAIPGPAPLALGDSVLYDAAQPLAGDGFHVNAMVCRTMAQGIVYLERQATSLPMLVVVALGTNATVSDAQVETLLRLLGPSRGLALVTPKGGDDPSLPALYRSESRRHPGRILVLDWERVSAGHPDWFAPDGIHLGGTAGIDAFAHLVASSLSALPGSGSATIPVPTTPPPTTATATTPVPTTTQPSQPAPAVVKPKPTHRAGMTTAERDQLRRIILDVRLIVSAAVSAELSLIGP